MRYELPTVRYKGGLEDVLRELFPLVRLERCWADWRIMKLLGFIDCQGVGWDLDRSCRELKLDISGAYAARLFKRCTGLGVREYAKTKRLARASSELATCTCVTAWYRRNRFQRVVCLQHWWRSLLTQCRSIPGRILNA